MYLESMGTKLSDAAIDNRHWSNAVGDPQLSDQIYRYRWVLDGPVVMAEPFVSEGKSVSLLLVQGAAGNATIDWGDWVDWLGGKPQLGAAPGSKLELRLVVTGGVLSELARK